MAGSEASVSLFLVLLKSLQSEANREIHGPPFGEGLFGAIVWLFGPQHTSILPRQPRTTVRPSLMVFYAPFHQDIIIPLSVALKPGSYGLIFGGGEFGSSGSGFMGASGMALPGNDGFAGLSQCLGRTCGEIDEPDTSGIIRSALLFMAKFYQSLPTWNCRGYQPVALLTFRRLAHVLAAD